jgi:hypothetical protein
MKLLNLDHQLSCTFGGDATAFSLSDDAAPHAPAPGIILPCDAGPLRASRERTAWCRGVVVSWCRGVVVWCGEFCAGGGVDGAALSGLAAGRKLHALLHL